MGNGASDTRNTIVVQPRNNTADFSNSNVDQRPSGRGKEHSINTSANISAVAPSSPPFDSEVYDVDEDIEAALAPNLTAGYAKGHSSLGPSCSVSQPEPCRTAETSTNDEIVFEVYHCSTNGREYCLINSDGARFYLDNWTTGEWQPFPEDWLLYGFIEALHRVEGTEPPNVSISDVQLEDRQTAPSDSYETAADRMGLLHHPTKGQLATYFMEETHNIPCVFDASCGEWLKLPMSWELHTPSCVKLIHTIQDAIPDWHDEYEILGSLRQCNYDADEVIATYISLLQDDVWTRMQGPQVRGVSELQALQKQVKDLEDALKTKEVEVELAQDKNRELKSLLSASESTARLLQTRVAKLQCDLNLAEERLTAPPPPPPPKSNTPVPIPQPIPQRQRVSPTTLSAVNGAAKSLSEDLLGVRETLSKGVSGIQFVLNQAVGVVREMKSQRKSHSSEVAELRSLYHKEAFQRRLLYNKLQELRGNIRVFCRCRFDASSENAYQFPSEQEIQVPSVGGEKMFHFDRVFAPSSTQEEVFQDTLPLITSCADGYNVCIMAYGQTGSGKTYTMMGPESNPGVNIRSIKELLKICKDRENIDYAMKVSMVEVYNETLRDLLSDKAQQQLNVQTKGKQVVVTNLTELPVMSADDIKQIMSKGHDNRSVGSTKMNTNSSRSHLLLVLHVQGSDHVSHAVSHGTLTLVDLAGSERISKTEATGQRLVEAAAINKSLTALGQVFMALRTNAMHVPYRNSKLTQLLQSSLGGDGKACVFVNVSPSVSNVAETLSTLHFGSAVKQVQLGKAVKNVAKLPK